MAFTAKDEAANKAAKLLGVDGEYTLPCIEVAGVQVYAYVKNGVLTVGVHTDTADPLVCDDEDDTRMRIHVNGTEVFSASRP